MAPSPIPLLIIVLATIAFEFTIFGDELIEREFTLPCEDGAPRNQEGDCPEEEERDCDGFSALGCWFRSFTDALRIGWGVVKLIFSLLTFDIPNAPIFVRIPFTAVVTVSFGWTVATFLRSG